MKGLGYHLAGAALLCAVAILAYSGTLHNGFVWDDNFQIVRNTFLHPDQPWKPLLSGDVWSYLRGGQGQMSNYYRPLQMVSYRLIAEAAGLKPWVFHLVNLGFHLTATLAAYFLIWQLTRRSGLSLAAAALFAVHPEHSEAVAWIASLPEMGCAIFFFLAFWLFLRAYESKTVLVKRKQQQVELPPTTRCWLIAASCIALLIALLWKEMALTLPAVIAAYAFIFVPAHAATWGARLRAAAAKSAPYWAAVAAYISLRFAVLGYFSTVQHNWELTPLQYGLSTVELVGQYWFRLAAPGGFSIFHTFVPAAGITEPRAIAALAFLIAGVALVFSGMRRAPLPSFAAAWVFITLTPVLNLRGVGENVFAERYLYIPSLGFCLLVAWLAAEALRRLPARAARWSAVAATSIVALAAIAQTRQRVPDWKDEYTLFLRATQASPKAALMHSSLAQVLLDRGDLNGAEQEYLRAIDAAQNAPHPGRDQVANAYVGLANVYTKRGEYQRALQALDNGEKTGSRFANLYVARGVVLLQLGRIDEAQRVLETADQYFPNDEVTLNALGVIAMAHHDYPRAIDYFRRTVAILTDYADGFNNLGRCYAEVGRMAEAVSSLQRAVELAPSNPMFHTNLGVALASMGRYDEARAQFETATRIDPNYQPAQAQLAKLQQVTSPR